MTHAPPLLPLFQPPVSLLRRTARLGWLAGLLALVVLQAVQAQPEAPTKAQEQPGAAFSFEQLATLARERAQAPYRAPAEQLPADLAKLDYDGVRDIRWRPERALWRSAGLPFEAMFFHLGLYHRSPVRIHEIAPQGVRPLAFDPADFDYGANRLATGGWGDLGFAGLRLHYPLNAAAYKDELIVFQGASYFRALGVGQQYGLSARGLAIDPHGGRGEEFPRFSEFWLERPAADARHATLYALLESPRATGAYRFDIRPGSAAQPATQVQVRARLFLRAGSATSPATSPIATLGLAPLTSMFFFGENQPRAGDFRPEVHDSDGLLIESGSGEWLWRPLQNPRRVSVQSFALPGVRGFGLMQRDRAFASYEDVEARYERRPSAWVQPQGDWGPGRVELLLLPTPDETHDNVVAYWVPARAPAPGTPLDFAYTLWWQGEAQQQPPNGGPLGRVAQTRAGSGWQAPGAKALPGEQHFMVDFAGPALQALPHEAEVQAVVSSDANGRVLQSTVYRNPAREGWRLSLRVQALDRARPVELRAFLRHRDQTLSETWSHVLLPP